MDSCSTAAAVAVAYWRRPWHAADCGRRHLATRNEMPVSGSDSYALMFLLVCAMRSIILRL